MRPKRTRVVTGIFRDVYGYALITKVRGVQLEQRWAPESDLDSLIAVRANWIVERKKGAPPVRHSFQRAARDYLATIPPKTRRHDDAARQLAAWLPAFKDCDVSTITAQLIRAHMATWRKAASTVNHRRQELKNLFTFLNGKAGANPVRDVPKAKERYDDARGQSPALIAAILAELPENQSKRCLEVWWETALPPSQQARLTRSTFHPKEKTIYAQPRRKGDGVPGRMLPLTANGVRALTAFFAYGLEGKPVSTSTIHRDFTAAVEKAKAKWPGRWPAPANLSPKDLRHSRLTEAYKRSKDLNAVAELGMHANLSTTQRYVRAVASESARSVIRAMEVNQPITTSRPRQKTSKTAKSHSGQSGRKRAEKPRK